MNWIEDILNSYLETALWSSVHYENEDDDGTPMDDIVDISHISPILRRQSKKDIEDFISLAEEALGSDAVDEMDSKSLGHNFWLDRNGYGAGFWDSSDYNQEVGDILSDISKKFGYVALHIGENGLVYRI